MGELKPGYRAGVNILFTLTSKPAASDDGEDEFAEELYEFKFMVLMIHR